MSTAHRSAGKQRFQWTIARKIGGLATVLMFFILLLILYSIVTLTEIQREVKNIAELDVPLSNLIHHLEVKRLEQQIILDRLLRLVQASAPNATNSSRRLIESLHTHTTALQRHISAGLTLGEAGLRMRFSTVFNDINAALLSMQQDTEQLFPELTLLVASMEASNPVDERVLNTVLARGTALDKKISALTKMIEQFTQREVTMLSRHERAVYTVNIALGVSGLLTGSVLSALIIVGIRTNLFRLTQQVSKVTQAIVENREIPNGPIDINSSDEIASLADTFTVMIDNLASDLHKRGELSRHLQKIAMTDQLTRAYNRLKWEETLATEIERIKRSHDELSMIIFDIDYFKSINDTFGHDVGDQVLIDIVALVNKQIRQTDSLYRIGGEEFIVLMPYTPLAQAAGLAEKLRQCIENQQFDKVGQITVSMGYAQFDKHNDEGEHMVRRADQALYRAKAQGRNKVCGG